MRVTEFNLKSNFEKLLSGLIESDDISYFKIDKTDKTIHFLISDWNVTLYDNGKWEIV